MTTGAVAAGAAAVLGAVSKPLEKFIEVVSAGCGKLYESTHQRRLAHAEVDRKLMIAKGDIEIKEEERRAAARWLSVDVARQENIDSIAAKAKEFLPEQVSDAPVERDWTARFFRDAQDISDDDMQLLWAKILAGEVAKPGSYSLRILRVISDLSKEEAHTFAALVENRFVLYYVDTPYVF